MDQRRPYFLLCFFFFFTPPVSHSQEITYQQNDTLFTGQREKPLQKRFTVSEKSSKKSQESEPFSFPEILIKSTFIEGFSQSSGIWPNESLHSEHTDFANADPFGVFNETSSFFGKGETSRGSPGLSLRGSQSLSRLQGLLDDIPLTPSDGTGMSSLFLPHEVLSEVRIIKGPSSLSYGGHAMGGALLFKPLQLHAWRTRMGVNSLGQGHLFLGGPLIHKEKNQLQVTLYGQTFKGSYPFDLPRLGLSDQRRHHTNRDLYRMTLWGLQKIKTWTFKERLLVAYETGRLPGPISNIFPQQQKKKATLASITTEKTFSKNSKTAWRMSYLNLDHINTNIENSDQFHSRSSTLSSSFSHLWSPHSLWILENGLDYSYSKYHSSNTPSELKNTTLEISTLSQILFSKNWIFQPGARYNIRQKKSLTSLGVKKYLSDREFLWGSYSQGYRSPSLTNTFYEDPFFVGNPHLKSEFSTQWETGFQKDAPHLSTLFEKRLSYMARFFLINYKDLISPVHGTPTTVDNISKANVFGIDAQFTWPLTTSTEIEWQYTHLQTRDHREKQLLFSPKNQVRLKLRHTWGKFIFEIQQAYWSPHQLSPDHRAREWHGTHFRVHTLELSKWSLRAGLLNIFNRPQELTKGYPEPQRRIYLSAERVL